MEDVKGLIQPKVQKKEREKEAFLLSHPRPAPSLCGKHKAVVADYELFFSAQAQWQWEKVTRSCPECELADQQESRLRQVNVSLGIPLRYSKAGHDSVYLATFRAKGGVVFSGGVGAGKTHEAITLLKNLYIEGDLVGYFETATDMAVRLKAAIATKTYAEEIDDLKGVGLLCIDDLGAENATPFMIESLYSILNHRYNEMLPIILTTNLSAKEFSEIYGQRLLSRLGEMASFVKLTGKDRRLSK